MSCTGHHLGREASIGFCKSPLFSLPHCSRYRQVFPEVVIQHQHQRRVVASVSLVTMARTAPRLDEYPSMTYIELLLLSLEASIDFCKSPPFLSLHHSQCKRVLFLE